MTLPLPTLKQTAAQSRICQNAYRNSKSRAVRELQRYQQRFEAAVSILGAPGQARTDRIQAVVRAYENDLNELVRRQGSPPAERPRARSGAPMADYDLGKISTKNVERSRACIAF